MKRLIAISGVTLLVACGGSTASKVSGHSKSNVVTATQKSNTSTTAKAPKASALAIVDKGFTELAPDSIGNVYLTYAVVLKNTTSDQLADSVELTISFTNAGGTVLKADSETVSVILPGQSAAVAPFGGDNVTGATAMNVQARVSRWETIKKVPVFTTSGVTTTSDRFTTKTNGTLASTFAKDLKSIKLTAVYKNGAGEITGGASTFVNFVPANGSTAFEVSAFSAPPDIAATDVYANVSSLTLLNG